MNKTTFSKSLIKFDNSSALPTEEKDMSAMACSFFFYNSHRFPVLFGKKVVSLQNRLRTNQIITKQ